MILVFVAFVYVGCSTFKGKETDKKDPIKKTEDIPDKVPGVNLVKITTETGHGQLHRHAQVR